MIATAAPPLHILQASRSQPQCHMTASKYRRRISNSEVVREMAGGDVGIAIRSSCGNACRINQVACNQGDNFACVLANEKLLNAAHRFGACILDAPIVRLCIVFGDATSTAYRPKCSSALNALPCNLLCSSSSSLCARHLRTIETAYGSSSTFRSYSKI